MSTSPPKQPLVSVVITCYNHAHFLGKAIESALDQTHRPLEVVVVDDGSTDHTAEVTARYSSVQYVKQENQGLSSARNTGIRKSSGRYVVFLDADDRLLPRALEAGLEEFGTTPAAFVAGAHVHVDPDGRRLEEPTVPHFDDGNHYRELLRGNFIGMHAAVMYRREVLESVGGFDTSLAACEDYELYMRITRRHPVSCFSEVVAEYCIHDANMSHDAVLMLRTALSALRGQWPYVQDDPQRENAYETGLRFWKTYYSPQLIRQIWECLRSGNVDQTVTAVRMLFRCIPAWFSREGLQSIKQSSFNILSPMLSSVIHRLKSWVQSRTTSPAVGHVDFGDLRSLNPVSRDFGFDRGRPIDRYYIEAFLGQHASDIEGRVLEVGDNVYTERFGGDEVRKSDVLHVSEDNPQSTIVADLAEADHVASNTFNCIILTQTLHLIYDVHAALATLHRILQPGGVLLLTAPGISQLEDGEWGDTWYWSFTTQSMQQLLEEVFPANTLTVDAHGNVLAATAFLQGLAEEELRREELDYHDPLYQLLITARAKKRETHP